ncbi:MAG: FAD-binding oxidoreductase [Myxococcales bacterium]|nr:FAD-binding oxidoreductase [Myxococcales bacterium]
MVDSAIPPIDRSERARRSVEGDFGGLSHGCATGVSAPRSMTELVSLVTEANRQGFRLTPRGAGLSQSGQSVTRDSVAVDLCGLRRVEVHGEHVACGAGATFRQVLDACVAMGRVPRALPLNLDLTVGGVLSAGGFGSTSHRDGLVVDSVAEVEAVLGHGERVRVRDGEQRDAILGGQGRCAIIGSATLETRALPATLRTHYLLYDDFAAFIHDQGALSGRVTHLEGFCTCAVQGLRASPGGRRPFARWFFGLHATSEEPIGDAEMLDGLHYREHLGSDETDAAEHASRYDLRFAAMRATGDWQEVHPWLEAFVPGDALERVPEILERLPLFLGSGHRLSRVAVGRSPRGIARPEGHPVYGFAVLPTGVPKAYLSLALDALQDANRRLLDGGAKRYLSGWLFEPDEAAWRRHFAGAYDDWLHWKRQFDPAGVLCSKLFEADRRVDP